MSTAAGRYPPVADGHEQWFIDESPKNRMVLALLSGIDEEVSWSLFRLGHLSYQHGNRFYLKPLFGLTDALLEWPMWYIQHDGGLIGDSSHSSHSHAFAGTEDDGDIMDEGWSTPMSVQRKRKHAMESLLILRNASFEDQNAKYIVTNRRTVPLLMGLKTLSAHSSNAEFITYLSELFQALAAYIVLPPFGQKPQKPIPPLHAIATLVSTSKDRSVIIALLSALSVLLTTVTPTHAHNPNHVVSNSPALDAAIRYLPLASDEPLLAASLDYLYAHLSHPPAAKAFLHHPELVNVLRMCIALLHTDQEGAKRTFALGPATKTAPQEPSLPLYQLTGDELEKLLATPEPQRCMDWLARMYVLAREDENEIQSNLWILYRDTFQPHSDRAVGGLAPAAEVIKRMMDVFPQTLAVLEQGPPQRYILKGIRRRFQEGVFKCRWAKGGCGAPSFESSGDLFKHIVDTHLEVEITQGGGADAMRCEWSTCPYGGVPINTLKSHILTHIPSASPPKKHPNQPTSITLPAAPYPHPSPTPTQRPPPPPPPQNITYTVPSKDPTSTSLTALLVVRVLFRHSFPDVGDPAPPVSDELRFGFPMPPALSGEIQQLAKDREDEHQDGGGAGGNEETHGEMEIEGQLKGKRAFERIGSSLAGVRLKEESLAAWVEEMVGAVGMVPFCEL
ncbi:Chromatin structure-remodeling complex protein rsc9 [Tulasnella sp. JGI-2019a]|nr:Chromatin structure-remodeling complex protein rsc9 [Tulasnella sp. JGI-2019a]